VLNGRPPLLARQKFNVEALEGLEEGTAIEETQSRQKGSYSEEIIARKNIVIFILVALCGVLALVILLLLIRS